MKIVGRKKLLFLTTFLAARNYLFAMDNKQKDCLNKVKFVRLHQVKMAIIERIYKSILIN